MSTTCMQAPFTDNYWVLTHPVASYCVCDKLLGYNTIYGKALVENFSGLYEKIDRKTDVFTEKFLVVYCVVIVVLGY